MDDNEGAIEAWSLFLGGLSDLGFVGMAIERHLSVHAVVLACLGALLYRGHPIVVSFAVVGVVLTGVDLVFWLRGLGGVMALVTG